MKTSTTPRPLKEPNQFKFPMKLTKFQRTIMPTLRGRTAEQGAVWKRFLADHPPGSVWANGVDCGQAIRNFGQSGVPNFNAYMVTLKMFLSWYPTWRKEETTRQRSIAGKKRKPRPPWNKLKQVLEDSPEAAS
jgi:hypothetical protein